MKTCILTLSAALLLCAASAIASEGALPQENSRLESLGQLSLRASSPDADFGTKGEKIGWIAQGEQVKVLSVKQVSTVFGFEVWVEVESSARTRGWIFDGMSAEVLKGKGNLSEPGSLPGQLLAHADIF